MELEKAVYGLALNEEEWLKRWQWWHLDNPAGPPIIWLAEHDGRIVGISGLIPRLMKLGDKIIIGGVGQDIMTYPTYRGQGMYRALINRVLDETSKKGMHVLYAFPNQRAWPLLVKKLHWVTICPSASMFKLLRLPNIMKRYVSNRFLSRICATMGSPIVSLLLGRDGKSHKLAGLVINEISSFDTRFDDFWKKASTNYDIVVVRDRDYLNWRYINVPATDKADKIYAAEKDGEICGYIVLDCVQGREVRIGKISDIFVDLNQNEVSECLISKAIEHFKKEKEDIIHYVGLADRPIRNIFRKKWFLTLSKKAPFWFMVYCSSPEIASYVGNRERWFIQTGDGDII